MFEVLRSVTGGHEPGEVKPAAAFAGCDLDWLVSSGAVRPVGDFGGYKPVPLPSVDAADQVGELHARVLELEDALKASTAERDELSDRLTQAESEKATLIARVAELEATSPPATSPVDQPKAKKAGSR